MLAALIVVTSFCGVAAAADLVVPIGPGNEVTIQGLTAPLPSKGPLGAGHGSLESIQIGGWDITFRVKRATSDEGTVKVTFDRSDGAASLRVEPEDDVGLRALAAVIRANLDRLKIHLRGERPHRSEAGNPRPKMGLATEMRGPPRRNADMQRSQWFAYALLILLFVGAWVARRELREALGDAWSRGGPAAAIVSFAAGALCWWLPDTVLYHDGNGWQLANSIAIGGTFQHGAMAHTIPSLLGAFAPEGTEASAASRVAYCLSLPVVWLWAQALFRESRTALVVLGVFATQPGFLYMSGAPFVASSAMLMVVLGGWLSALAMRQSSPRLLFIAAAALAIVANFRVSGPFMGPGLALIALAVRPVKPRPPAFWRYAMVAALAIGILALPRLVGIATLQGKHQMILPGAYQIVESIFGQQHWAPAALLWLAIGGLVATWIPSLRRSPAPRGAGAQASVRPLIWTLGIFAAVGFPLVAGVMAVDNWINVLRYQGWALLGCVLGVGPLARWLSSVPWHPLSVGALSGALVGAYGISVYVPAQAQRFDHLEQTQLRLWNQLAEALPPNATLAIPTVRGSHAPYLPTIALQAERPDITIIGLTPEHAGFKADYWFEPVLCGLPFFDAPGQDSCEISAPAIRTGQFAPVRTAAAAIERVPLYEAAGSFPMRATERYWMSPPVSFVPPPPIGLYRVTSGVAYFNSSSSTSSQASVPIP